MKITKKEKAYQNQIATQKDILSQIRGRRWRPTAHQQVSLPARILRNFRISRGEETIISGSPESEVLSMIRPFTKLHFSGTGLIESIGSLHRIEGRKSEQWQSQSLESSSRSQNSKTGYVNGASLEENKTESQN